MLESGLSKLRRHLRGRVIHELPIRAKHIPTAPSLLLIRIASLRLSSLTVLLTLRGAWWWRR